MTFMTADRIALEVVDLHRMQEIAERMEDDAKRLPSANEVPREMQQQFLRFKGAMQAIIAANQMIQLIAERQRHD